MKNLFIGLGVLAMIGATSCKKDYTCECTFEGNGVSGSVAETSKLTKKDAQEWCDEGSTTSGGVTTKCELK